MKSRLPKVLHPLCGSPMVRLVIEVVRRAGLPDPLMVVPPEAHEFQTTLGESARYVEQREPRGTGDALAAALAHLEDSPEHLLVINGDVPLLRPESLQDLMNVHTSQSADLTFLTARGTPSQGLGRVVRGGDDAPVRIVEAAEDDEGTHALPEVNVGVYCFRIAWARASIATLRPSHSGEVYLTNLVELAHQQGARVATECLTDPLEGMGINNRLELAQAEGVLRQRIREYWMIEGVTMVDPSTVYIDWDVALGRDTILYPNTLLLGRTSIGAECEIGPGSVIRDSAIGDRCRVQTSVIEEVVLEEEVEVGPFSHLRLESYIEQGVHIGNFAEVKKSRLGRGVRMGHFSYIGDASIGANVNIGAGTITCNFDGTEKHQTVVEEDVFLGSDTMLVAPVRVGARAATGAGAVVTKDVPPDTMVVGAPARVVRRNQSQG